MNRRTDQPSLLNLWTILGALAVAGCLVLITLISIGWLRPHASETQGFVPADLTIIAPPTATVNPTATSTPSGTVTPPPGQIGVGGYVQITGQGVRLHSAASLNSDTLKLVSEPETFLVKDGPQTADGHTWWYVVAPYDSTRAGWAAADFLTAIPSP